MRRRQFIAGLGGVAVAWPVKARAQQPALPTIGYLSGARESGFSHLAVAFRQGLGERGYVEGRNVEILYRWANLRNDLLPALAADLVQSRVAVLVTSGGPAAHLAAKSATGTIPIVFATGADPVGLGLVASFNRPGGNLTGVSFLSALLVAKRFEVLHEAVPTATSIAYIANPTGPLAEAQVKDSEAASRLLGVRLVVLNASTPSEIEAAFANLAGQRIGAVVAGSDPVFTDYRDQFATLAARHGVPAIYANREPVDAGGLMSYGASFSDAWRLAGNYAGRILMGEKPADLPVQQSTKVELVLNMRAAKALGLIFPITLLGRADEVIE
jgi:putative tryptophan/tyrosine transport system substrate-binding protein